MIAIVCYSKKLQHRQAELRNLKWTFEYENHLRKRRRHRLRGIRKLRLGRIGPNRLLQLDTEVFFWQPADEFDSDRKKTDSKG